MVFTISTGSPLNRRSRTISVSHSLVQSVSLIVLFNQCLSQSRTISVSHSLVQTASFIVLFNQCLSQSRLSVSLIVSYNQCLIVSIIVLAQRKSRRKNNFWMNETMTIAIKVPQVFRCCILIFSLYSISTRKNEYILSQAHFSPILIFPPEK